MELTICGLDELPQHANKSITHILSLIDAEYMEVLREEGNPNGPPMIVNNLNHRFAAFDPHCRVELHFDDVSYPNRFYQAPTPEDVRAILEYADQIPDDAKVLVHCVAGQSRSTAAATLLLMKKHPDWSAERVFHEILRIRPIARPNTLILSYGGHELGRKVELEDAWRREKRFHLTR